VTGAGRSASVTTDRRTTIETDARRLDQAGSTVTLRVAFATAPAATIGDHDTDRPRHDAACATVGIELDHQVWSDPAVRWDRYDLVVVRSSWDYLDHLDEFRAWLGLTGRLGTLHNPAPVITWNLDKSYLLDLAHAGVPVIATTVCSDITEVSAALGWVDGEVVVKPVVSAGSRQTGRFSPADPSASALAAAVLAQGTQVLVQPAVPSVATRGEVSTLVFDGSVSHSVRKGPLLALGGGLMGGTYTENLTAELLTPSLRALVERTSAAVAGLVADRFGVTDPLLYARIDVVALDDGTEVVLEVELAEPSFFLAVDPTAADRFAAALARRCGSDGSRTTP
jgi:glutathione synthase/RimK-type ligase-like ATP-grasp enzyme